MPDAPRYVIRRTDITTAAVWLLMPASWAAAMHQWEGDLHWDFAVGPFVSSGEVSWLWPALGLLILPLIQLMQRFHEVRLDGDGLVIRGAWGRPRRIPYAELDRVEPRTFPTRSIVLAGPKRRAVLAGNLEPADDLLRELQTRITGAASAPASRAGATLGALCGSALILAWAASLSAALVLFGRSQDLLAPAAALLAGLFAPSLAYFLSRRAAGPLRACHAAAQAAVILVLLVAVRTAVSSDSVFPLLVAGWTAVGLAVAAAVSPLLPEPAPGTGAGMRAVIALVPLVAALAAAGIGLVITAPVAKPETVAVFHIPGSFLEDDSGRLPGLTFAPRDGRHLCLTAARPYDDGHKVLLARIDPIAPTEEGTLDNYVEPQSAHPPARVLWSPDGSATAVLFGRPGRSDESVSVRDVHMVWWESASAFRTVRQFRRMIALRGFAWSADNKHIAIQTGSHEDNRNPEQNEPSRVYRLSSGGDAGTGLFPVSDALRLVGWRPALADRDERLVFESTDRLGRVTAEYHTPAPDLPQTASVGPALPAASKVVRTALPLTGRFLARSPHGRFRIHIEAGSLGVWDHWTQEKFEVDGSSAADVMRNLAPANVEPLAAWSGDGSTVLLTATSLTAGKVGADRVLVVNLSARTLQTLELPGADRAVDWSLSFDGRFIAWFADEGSPRELVERLRSLWDSSAASASTPRLRRAILIADRTADRIRALPMMVPARQDLPGASSPAFLWPCDRHELLVVLSEPRSSGRTRVVHRLALPE